MLVVRPSHPSDIDGLYALASSAAGGLTTLPKDRDMLAGYLDDSQRAFERNITKPRGERYLLVMEDVLSGALVGCAGIKGRVGGFEPHYTYELSSEVKSCTSLGVHKTIQTLHLTETHKGPSEIGTLFVERNRRGHGGGRLMSLSRFLFMGGAPHRFAPTVIAEMRGVSDDEGLSPFWENIGRHFFDLNFAEADLLSAADKQFIADLMPRQPIYVPMLSAEAQAVVAAVHQETEPALKLLMNEGFRFANAVDIFDAGPIYVTETNQVRTIKEMKRVTLGKVGEIETDERVLISTEASDFRATMGQVELISDSEVKLNHATALALKIKLGQPLYFAPMR